MKGATLKESIVSIKEIDFNPRSREGSDPSVACFNSEFTIISIHAPVKGATSSLTVSDVLSDISIHAPVKGATGLQRLQRLQRFRLQISIHAPVKGATQKAGGAFEQRKFQSTLP